MGGRRCVSVDLGGTKISAALVDDGYAMLTDCNVATNAKEGVDAVIGRINACIRKVCDDGGVKASDLCGIGICSPGPLSVRTGTVTYVATLGWYGVPIKAILEGEFGVPVSLENDANAAALGEALMGAGKGMENVVYITLSTGIGSGIVIGGKVYYGKNEAAGELGHICVEPGGRPCSCGHRGCLQSYSSGTSIAAIASEGLEGDPGIVSSLRACGRIGCREVELAAREGDAYALGVWKAASARLGQGISILFQLLDPDCVILGGSVTNAWDLFYGGVMGVLRESTYDLIYKGAKVLKAELNPNAGIIGTAGIVFGS